MHNGFKVGPSHNFWDDCSSLPFPNEDSSCCIKFKFRKSPLSNIKDDEDRLWNWFNVLSKLDKNALQDWDRCSFDVDNDLPIKSRKFFKKFKEFCLPNAKIKTLTLALEDAKQDVVWNCHPKGWNHCLVSNHSSTILIGYVQQLQDGYFYIYDRKQATSFVLIDPPTTCTNQYKCQLDALSKGCLVAIKRYYFLFDQYRNEQFNTKVNLCLLVDSSSFLLLEETNYLDNSVLPTNLFSSGNSNETKNRYAESGNDLLLVMNMFEKQLTLKSTCIGRQISTPKKPFMCTEFTIVLKVWSHINYKLSLIKAYVVIHNKRIINANNSDEIYDILNHKEHSTKIENDLLYQMSSLCIIGQDDYETVLNFTAESKKLYPLVVGHNYYMVDPVRSPFHKTSTCTKPQNDSAEMFVQNGALFVHAPSCDNSVKLKSSRIEEVVKEKRVSKPTLQAVLVDKIFFKDLSGSSSVTLCLLLKDDITADTLRLYVPNCPGNFHGLLPGDLLLLFGCLCIQSKNNTLYLRASASFGIRLLKSAYVFDALVTLSYGNKLPKLLKAETLDTKPFLCQAFLYKITSAKITLSCDNCTQDIKMCSISQSYSVKAFASFTIDDGNNTCTMQAAGEDVQFLLRLTDSEWNFFRSHVKEKQSPLEFSHKDSLRGCSLIDRIFHCLCSNKALNRFISCYCIPHWTAGETSHQLNMIYSCKNISEPKQDTIAIMYASICNRL